MADIQQLKEIIQENIHANNAGEITGDLLQQILIRMVNELDEKDVSSIVDLGVVASSNEAFQKAASDEIIDNPKISIITWRTSDSSEDGGRGNGGVIFQQRHSNWYITQWMMFEGTNKNCVARSITTGGNKVVGSWYTMVIPTNITLTSTTTGIQLSFNSITGNAIKTISIPEANSLKAGLLSSFYHKKLYDLPTNSKLQQSLDAASLKIFDLEWEAAGGQVVESGKTYAHDSVNDLTLSEAIQIKQLHCPRMGCDYGCLFYKLTGVRTLLPIWVPKDVGINFWHAFYGCASLKYVTFYSGSSSRTVKIDDLFSTFSGCLRLQQIGGTIDIRDATGLTTAFSGCLALESVQLKNLTSSISFASCRDLSFYSLEYLLQNAINVSPITVTLHANTYAKLTEDLIILATEKSIAIATA